MFSKGFFLKVVNCVNPLSSVKILDMTKLKAFADDKLNVANITISLFDREENTAEKEQNAGYQHFVLFPRCFPKSLKVRIM